MEEHKVPYRHTMKLSRDLTSIEDSDIREAYTSLKVLHLQLKERKGELTKKVKELTQEVNDYKERYNHLIKYLNTNDLV